MKIVFIGDIHGRDTWKQIIKEQPDADLIIFAGDYVSSHERISDEKQIKNLKEILKYKENNPDKVILLRGNHDLQHLGYHWAECSGVFKDVADWMSSPRVKSRFLKDTQWIYIHDNIIFSHAGISETWFKSLGVNKLEDINNLPVSDRFGFTPEDWKDYYGESKTQPCTWIRPSALVSDFIDDFNQVVGHTPLDGILAIQLGDTTDLWICDTLPLQYLVVEDGTFSIKYVGGKPLLRLPNRYGFMVYLEHIDGNKWALRGDDAAMNYMGVGFQDKHIIHIDPSGGPFLAEGDRIIRYKKTIKSITEDPDWGFVLELEDYEGEEV